jgi:hypothetical protein
MDQQNTRMCTGCGRQIPVEYNVCPHCGRPQNAPQYAPAPGPQPYGQPYAPPQQESLGALKYILYLISFFSIVIGFIMFLVWNNDPNPEKKHVGKNCLLLAIAGIVLSVLCWVVGFVILGVSMMF